MSFCIKSKLNSIIFYLILFHLSCGDVFGRITEKSNVAGKLKNEKISNKGPKSIDNLKIPSEGRNSYLKPDLFYNRDIYDYSPGFDSFFNNIKNYPQSSVSYYPFSLQNMDDYYYPKVFNRFYPYTSNIMPKTLQSPLDFPAQDRQIPFYRDAENYQPLSELQIVKRLVPIGYSSHLVTQREAEVVPSSEVLFDSTATRNLIAIPNYPNYSPSRSAAVDSTYDHTDVLLKAVENAAKVVSNSTDTQTSTNLRDKIESVGRVMIMVPSVADEVFKCLSESKVVNKLLGMSDSGDKKTN